MATKLVLLFVLLYAIEISLAAMARESSPAGPKLQSKGFTCFKKGLGPMRNGQVNNNYSSKVCGRVTCNHGVLSYETCSSYYIDGQPMKPQDATKPFPGCCNYFL